MHYKRTAVWQKALRLAEESCRKAAKLPRTERYTIRPQIVRAATSVVSNIAEGWARESIREKAQFLSIAQGSLAGLHTQLLLCSRLEWIDSREMAPLFALEHEVGSMLTALRRHFRKKRPSIS